MDTFKAFLDQYALIVVLIGAAACVLTNLIKLPIQKMYKQQAETDPTLTDLVIKNKLRSICLCLVAGFCLIGILLYYGLTVRSWDMFKSEDIYLDYFSSIVVAKALYFMYESGDLKFSPKKIFHTITSWLTSVFTNSDKIKKSDVTALVQDILTNVIGLPLTDDQKEAFDLALNGCINPEQEKESNEEITSDQQV